MINPILASSALRRMRQAKTHVIMALSLSVFLLVSVLILSGFLRPSITLGTLTSGTRCYQALILLQFVLILLIAPSLTSGSIAGEREKQTLELLLTTNTGAFRIVMGKLLESFACMAMIMVFCLPVMCMLLITGCVTLGQILLGEGFLLACALACSSVGLFASTVSRTTIGALILSFLGLMLMEYLFCLPALLGYPQSITDVLYDPHRYADLSSTQAARMLGPVLLLNPGVGLFSLLNGQTGFMDSSFTWRDWGRIKATYMMIDRAGPEVILPIGILFLVLFSLLLVVCSALLIRPLSRRGPVGRRKKA